MGKSVPKTGFKCCPNLIRYSKLATYNQLGDCEVLNRHYKTVARLAANHSLKYLVRDYFGLPVATALMPAMLDKGLGQADLVLCLLRIRDAHKTMRHAVEEHITSLIGQAIQACPSCLLHYNPPSKITRSPDDRRLVHVTPVNPRQEGTDAHMRWCEYRVGRTIGQLIIRGVTKRDIRRAVRNGWIRVEEMA